MRTREGRRSKTRTCVLTSSRLCCVKAGSVAWPGCDRSSLWWTIWAGSLCLADDHLHRAVVCVRRKLLDCRIMAGLNFVCRSSCLFCCCVWQDCSFPAYFYTQPMATGPGFYDNLCPQSWQDGSAATFTLQDPHQQSEFLLLCARVLFFFVCLLALLRLLLQVPRCDD